MKSRALDFILVATIVVSGGFVGYRLFRGQNSTVSEVTRATNKLGSIAASNTSFDAAPTRIPFGLNQKLLLSIRPQTAESWKTTFAEGDIAKYLTTETDSCKKPLAPNFHGYPILVPEVKTGISDGRVRVLSDTVGMNCVKVGNIMPLFMVSFENERPALEVFGNVKIEEILQIPYDDISESIAQLLGTRLTVFKTLQQAGNRFGTRKFSLMRFNKVEPPTFDKSQPLKVLPGTPVVSAAALAGWLRQRPNAVIIDVRREEEAAATPLVYEGRVINAPYVPKDAKTEFRWSKTVAEINADTFNAAPVLAIASRNVPNAPELLVIGSAPEDGRVPWAILSLIDIGVGHMSWYFEGVMSFNANR